MTSAQRGRIVALAGDVADPWHRHALIDAAGDAIDLVVNNASDLGPSPLPPLAELPLDRLEQVLRVNVLAPLAVAQLALPTLVEGARVVNVTSDAAVEAYAGLGRLRRVEGGAGAAHGGARGGASRRCGSTPSTPAT